ncbi:MAG: hypothetical protein JST66_11490 [Bacteroidetes bacterium]|nr:hypothetical protein [Bacteroidota bacterium]
MASSSSPAASDVAAEAFDLESVMAEIVRLSAVTVSNQLALARVLSALSGTAYQDEREKLFQESSELAEAIALDLIAATQRRRAAAGCEA